MIRGEEREVMRRGEKGSVRCEPRLDCGLIRRPHMQSIDLSNSIPEGCHTPQNTAPDEIGTKGVRWKAVVCYRTPNQEAKGPPQPYHLKWGATVPGREYEGVEGRGVRRVQRNTGYPAGLVPYPRSPRTVSLTAVRGW